jgi:clan AA aspartic protease
MECDTMGRVLTEATIANLKDLWDAERGLIPPEHVRRVTVTDALVDTGATGLSLPMRLIQQLGLGKRSERRATAATGTTQVAMYEAVRLIIQERDMTVDVTAVPDDVPVLIGQIPLEALDLVVDPKNRRLIGNPAHGGEHVIELY